jgi:DnaJ-class molecular chaperone
VKPSEAVAAGICPSCFGSGLVARLVPVEDLYPCATCGGSGRWPPRCRVCQGEVVAGGFGDRWSHVDGPATHAARP